MGHGTHLPTHNWSKMAAATKSSFLPSAPGNWAVPPQPYGIRDVAGVPALALTQKSNVYVCT